MRDVAGGQFTDLPGSPHAQLDVSGVLHQLGLHGELLLQRRRVGDGVSCGSSSSWCVSSGSGTRGSVLHGCLLRIAMAALADPLLSKL